MLGASSCKQFFEGPSFLWFGGFSLKRLVCEGALQGFRPELAMGLINALVQTDRLPEGLKLALGCGFEVAHLVGEGDPGSTQLLTLGQVGSAPNREMTSSYQSSNLMIKRVNALSDFQPIKLKLQFLSQSSEKCSLSVCLISNTHVLYHKIPADTP